MGILNAFLVLLISLGLVYSILLIIRKFKEKKKAFPIYKLSYSGEYAQKNIWTKEIILLIILFQGLGFLKLWFAVNILLLTLIVLLIALFFLQLSRGVLGEMGIVSATRFYRWDEINSVEWITDLQADNPGYPSWGLVRFHAEKRTVEFIIKKKVEEEVRSFVEQQMADVSAKTV
ncbi:hypothetical protein [Bacillus sp. NEB1478]|uniref:hypothetical protein n=1 Tax=Bacillus sp. NEB1478 TaxID=3073816 RepID=UPI002873CDD7|nr:hypothetical protein [Bacillus sp. NEB1478]WNB91281.1 hypothetical protein RGB74_15440 [Bacillus sp. NEB1478]